MWDSSYLNRFVKTGCATFGVGFMEMVRIHSNDALQSFFGLPLRSRTMAPASGSSRALQVALTKRFNVTDGWYTRSRTKSPRLVPEDEFVQIRCNAG